MSLFPRLYAPEPAGYDDPRGRITEKEAHKQHSSMSGRNGDALLGTSASYI